MKLVLTVHQFLPDYSSGTEILTYETAKQLQRLGHEVIVFTGHPDPAQLPDEARFDNLEYDGIRVHRFRHSYMSMGGQTNIMKLQYYNLLFGKFFEEFLHREKPDLVHFFHLARLSVSAVDACRKLGIPTILTPTDFWFICPTSQLRLPNNKVCSGPDKYGANCLKHITENSGMPPLVLLSRMTPIWIFHLLMITINRLSGLNRFGLSMLRALSNRRDFLIKKLNKIDRVIVPSKIMESALLQNGLNNEKIIRVRFGLNLTYLKNTQRPKPSRVLRIGYIGSLIVHKGVHVLLKAVSELQGQPIELAVYGKIENNLAYANKLKKIAGKDQRIKFMGAFPNSNIGDIFSRMDVLVIPSLWHENTPLVLYSAQAAKCPVIGSNMKGISEVIKHGENGLLFTAGSVSDLKDSILTLVKDRSLLQIQSSNALSPLSMPEYAHALVNVYKELQLSGKTL